MAVGRGSRCYGGRGGGVPAGELDHYPAGGITWHAAHAFCAWLASALSFTRGARLPGEEEWEYACRAGGETPYWSGSEVGDLDRVGWYCDNSSHRTHRVGEKPANAWGLVDGHGNVREWTANLYRRDYAYRAATADPHPARVEAHEQTAGDLMVILRGGGYLDEAPFCRSAIRCVRHPGNRYLNVGFRVLLPAA